MLNITRIVPRSNLGADDMLRYLQASEYYLDNQGEVVGASVWVGSGSNHLNLSGEVSPETMSKVAMGFAPDGSKLVQNAGDLGTTVVKKDRHGNTVVDEDGQPVLLNEGGRVLGWDFTFNPPKDISIVMASSDGKDRDEIIEAHHKAVGEAIKYLETLAEVRTGKAGTEVVSSNGIVASRHTHFGSRDLDPQLHSHVFVMNLGQGPDGKWRALETDAMYGAKRDIGALYRFALASEMKKLGYGIEAERELDDDGKETGEVSFKIAGVSQELCDEFSKRRKAIVDYNREHGGTMEQANLATRKNKDEPTFKELTDNWKQALEQWRRENPETFKSVNELKGRESKTLISTDKENIDRLHAMESVFDDHKLMGRLAKENVGKDMSVADLMAEMKSFEERNNLVKIAPEQRAEMKSVVRAPRRYREHRFASQEMVAMERQCVERARVRSTDKHHMLPEHITNQAIERFEEKNGFKISNEQKKAVLHVASNTGGVAVLTGLAGTGKTTVSSIWIDALKEQGFNVMGASTSWAAAKKLEAESGIPSYSTASLIKNLDDGKMSLKRNDVLVLDEAGMAGTKSILRLQEHCDKVGAKMVLQGDPFQLQPIEAGAGFRLIRDTVGEATLTEIRRQKNQQDKDTAKAFYEASSNVAPGSRTRKHELDLGERLFSRLENLGQVDRNATRADAIKSLTKDYLADSNKAREKLVICGTKAENRLVNEAIRDGLKTQGVIDKSTLASFEVINQGKKETIEIGVGDRIRLTERNKAMDVFNGEEAVIKSMAPSKKGGFDVVIALDSDIKTRDGRQLTFNTEEFARFEHAYSMTVHKSQGQGRSAVFQLANPKMTDQHLALVGFTRTKDNYCLYGSTGDLEEMAKRMGKERLKENAIESGVITPSVQTPKKEADFKSIFKARRAELEKTILPLVPTMKAPSVKPVVKENPGMER